MWAQSYLPFRNVAISASNVTLVVDLALAVLSTLEHTNSIQPSSTINAYLFFSVLFDAVIVRTLWLTPFCHKTRDVFTATFVLKVWLLLLEAVEKRKYYINLGDKQRSPEESSGIYNQAVYWWLNAIIFKGYQQELIPADLYPISRNIAAETLDSRFWHSWESCAFLDSHFLLVNSANSKPPSFSSSEQTSFCCDQCAQVGLGDTRLVQAYPHRLHHLSAPHGQEVS